jgi:hypothetical protein
MALASAGLTLLLWVVFTWPQPRFFFSGIPSSAKNVEKDHVRAMIHGDHLQLLYHYWLFTDMLQGETPWCRNPYEFNTGDKPARPWSFKDNLPFSIVYAAGAWVSGRAGGWNINLLLNLWGSLFFTALLLGRYVRSEPAAVLIASTGLALPFRWATLLGGSPTGLAVMWLPLIMYGIDKALLSGRLRYSLLAAAAITFSYFNDAHVFFFGALAVPFWCIFCALWQKNFPWKEPRRWTRPALSMAPVALCLILLVFWGKAATSAAEAETGSLVRKITEVQLYSPRASAVFEWSRHGYDYAVYLGIAIPALIAAAALTTLIRHMIKRNLRKRRIAAHLALVAGMAVICALALGPNGPFDGQAFILARKLIPPYGMLRQPGKIFCLLTVLAPLSMTLGIRHIQEAFSRKAVVIAALVIAAVAVAAYAPRIEATVCLLDKKQPAYGAVAADAREQGIEPRAVAISFWPGDSAWASLYQHYASLYRVYMVNGYSPVVPGGYIEDVFEPLGPLNVGFIGDSQLRAFKELDINYIILHEDAFPEKVSPFPVGFTLKRLLEHENLSLLKQYRNVWAFKVTGRHEKPDLFCQSWDVFFPSFRHQSEHAPVPKGLIEADPSADNNHYISVSETNAAVRLQTMYHWSPPDPFLIVRVRGTGSAEISFTEEHFRTGHDRFSIRSSQWKWKHITANFRAGSSRTQPEINTEKGRIDMDLAVLSSGRLTPLAPGRSTFLPAPLFFHAGYTDPEQNAVKLRSGYEADSNVFYGPRLPLAPGRYRISLDYDSPAPVGTRLGAMHVKTGHFEKAVVDVRQGKAADAFIDTDPDNLLFEIAFHYSRNADITLHGVNIRREKEETANAETKNR